MERLHDTSNLWWTFDTLDDETYKDLLSEKQRSPAKEPEKRLCCKMCGQAITREKDKIERDGAHMHLFTNPHGLRFHIGCFRDVSGCVEIGKSTEEFTWFLGYGWRIALCGSCHEHLGWNFRSDGSDRFYGLILNRLAYPN